MACASAEARFRLVSRIRDNGGKQAFPKNWGSWFADLKPLETTLAEIFPTNSSNWEWNQRLRENPQDGLRSRILAKK
jgi:hypothetical protein